VGGCYGRKRLLGGEPEDALRLEHGVCHLVFGHARAELCRSLNVHLLTYLLYFRRLPKLPGDLFSLWLIGEAQRRHLVFLPLDAVYGRYPPRR